MIIQDIPSMILTLAISLFVIGVILVGAGLFILLARAFSSDMHIIAQQTTRLAQKGIAEEVSGLVGNASGLVEALNQLVRTASGIGTFLILAGIILFASSYLLLLQVR
jgi:hypothetical protein